MANPLDFLRFSRKKRTSDQGTESAAAEVAAAGDAAPAAAPEAAAPQAAAPTPDAAAPQAAAPAPDAAAPVPATPAAAPAPEAAAPAPQAEPQAAAPVAPQPQVTQPRAGQLAQTPAVSAQSPRDLYGGALRAVGRFFGAAAKINTPEAEALPISDVRLVAGQLVETMVDDDVGDEMVALAVGRYPDSEHFIVPHSVNVAVISQRVARQLGLEGGELLTLAVAALVHDVGTVRLPKESFYKADSLTNTEWELMRQRPTHSHEIISTLGAEYRAVAEIAFQVHERLDGHGYPRGLRINDIALEASILGAVDIFEAFIHPRPYKKTVPAAAMYGVDNLMRMSHQFGDGVLKALVRSVGLFPVGTHVKLNSGEVARVVKGRSGNPMRPEVEVVFDTQSRELDETRRIDLMTTPHLYVFKPLSPEDLAELGL